METIFNSEFWTREWKKDTTSDTYAVHKGFSTPEYWDKAAATYNLDKVELQNLRLEKTLEIFRQKEFLFPGVKVLDIGCGTGNMALALAKEGARVTALDFSQPMLDRVKNDLPQALAPRVQLLKEDWLQADIAEKGWEKQFDLVIAFMSPGVATPAAFFKMIQCAKKGCAVRGWAARKQPEILLDLWKKIMDKPLEDKPQSILYKLNLLFSLGLFPDIFFDVVEWDQTIALEPEYESQIAFFSKVSDKPTPLLETLIREYLESRVVDGHLQKKQKGLTATAIFSVHPLL